MKPALADFAEAVKTVAWEAPAIGALIKETVGKHGLKMPKLAMPLRVAAHGAGADAIGRRRGLPCSLETVVARLQRGL